jgi:hypothetical protein
MMRARGGSVSNPDVHIKKPGRTAEGYPKSDYGSLSGKGRLQKVEMQKKG